MEQTIENFEGTKNVNVYEGGESMGDVQAGIEFIYHMFACYALYLWLKKVIK